MLTVLVAFGFLGAYKTMLSLLELLLMRCASRKWDVFSQKFLE